MLPQKCCLMVLPFLPVWSIPFETQPVRGRGGRLQTVMWNLYWSFSSPAHLQGKYYWNSCWRCKQRPKNIPSTKVRIRHTSVHTGGEERMQERHSFPGPLESLGCFSSCSACFKGARVWELLGISLPPAIPGYQSRRFALQCSADLKLINLSFLPIR